MGKSSVNSNHQNLIVYQKAKIASKEMFLFFSKKKYSRTYDFLILQLLRALYSIGANIAEGYGRHYRKNYRQFLSIARGSCFEAQYWLESILEIGLIDKTLYDKYNDICIEIGKMLTVMMKKLEIKS